MRLTWIAVLTVLITITSGVINLNGFAFFEYAQVEMVPQLEGEVPSLYNSVDPLKKSTHRIAQNFIPIVILAEAFDHSHSFVHYQFLYHLYRQKDFFLLI